MFCAQNSHNKYCGHDCLDWYNKPRALSKQIEPNESKSIFRNLNRTDSVKLKQYANNSSSTHFQVQIKTNQTPLTVAKLNTVHTDVFAHETINNESITSIEISKSRCKDDQKNFFH